MFHRPHLALPVVAGEVEPVPGEESECVALFVELAPLPVILGLDVELPPLHLRGDPDRANQRGVLRSRDPLSTNPSSPGQADPVGQLRAEGAEQRHLELVQPRAGVLQLHADLS